MTENDNDETIREGTVGQESAGTMIRAARERAGWSHEQLAERVNLLRSQIVALESDQYGRLPGPVFVRGYLRAVACALGLDEAALLAAWQPRAPAAEAKTARPAAAAAPGDGRPMRPISLERAPSWRRHWGLAAAALVVAGLWGWQQREHEGGRAQSLAPTVADGDIALGGIEDALNGDRATRLLDSVELLPASRPAPAPQAPAVAQAGGDQSAAPLQPGADDGRSKTLTASGDQLSLRFSADCWVEIKDRDNRVLVAALKRANEQLQLEGRGPFRVLLGFAPGVEMAYNGTPVNIEVPQGSRSTRLIVGSS